MKFTEQMTEALAVVGYLAPTNHGVNTDTQIAGIDMSVLRRLITYVQAGVIASGGNIQVYYRASANANMNVTTNVASAIPVVGNTNGRVLSLEVRSDQLPNGCRYVQPVIIFNTAAAFASALCLGDASGYAPAKQYNIVNTVDATGGGIVT